MPFLDLKTIVVVGLALEGVCTLVMAGMWRQARHQYEGLGLWTLDFALQVAGLFLILLRGVVPDWASIFLANLAIAAGAWLGLRGGGV